MQEKSSGRLVVAGACLGVVTLVTTIVLGAPMIPGGTGSYAGVPMGTVKPMWPGPAGTRIALKVQTTAGTVRVQPGTGSPLGPVPSGKSSIFEGDWPALNGYVTVGPASWSYETRGDTIAYAGTDGTVGTGTLALAASPNPAEVFTVYKNFAATAAYRALTPTAGTSTVTVRTSQGGSDMLSVDAGDWSYFGINNASLLCLNGNGNVSYGVYDMKPGNTACAGSASGGGTDTDAIYVDGSKNLKITVSNTGSVPVTVTCSPLTGGTIAVGGSQTYTGAFNQFSWTYGGAGGEVSLQIVAN